MSKVTIDPLSAIRDKVAGTIESLTKKKKALEDRKDEYLLLQKNVDSSPADGKIMMALGENYFAERSPPQAKVMLNRRLSGVQKTIDEFETNIESAKETLKKLEDMLDYLDEGSKEKSTAVPNHNNDEELPFMNIMEQLDEEGNVIDSSVTRHQEPDTRDLQIDDLRVMMKDLGIADKPTGNDGILTKTVPKIEEIVDKPSTLEKASSSQKKENNSIHREIRNSNNLSADKPTTKVDNDLSDTTKKNKKTKYLDLSSKANKKSSNTSTENNSTKITNISSVTGPQVKKIHHDWFQTPSEVNISLFIKNTPKDKTKVIFKPYSIKVEFPLLNGSTYTHQINNLSSEIDPNKSTFIIFQSKIEFSLKKLVNHHWNFLQVNRIPENKSSAFIHPSKRHEPHPNTKEIPETPKEEIKAPITKKEIDDNRVVLQNAESKNPSLEANSNSLGSKTNEEPKHELDNSYKPAIDPESILTLNIIADDLDDTEDEYIEGDNEYHYPYSDEDEYDEDESTYSFNGHYSTVSAIPGGDAQTLFWSQIANMRKKKQDGEKKKIHEIEELEVKKETKSTSNSKSVSNDKKNGKEKITKKSVSFATNLDIKEFEKEPPIEERIEIRKPSLFRQNLEHEKSNISVEQGILNLLNETYEEENPQMEDEETPRSKPKVSRFKANRHKDMPIERLVKRTEDDDNDSGKIVENTITEHEPVTSIINENFTVGPNELPRSLDDKYMNSSKNPSIQESLRSTPKVSVFKSGLKKNKHTPQNEKRHIMHHPKSFVSPAGESINNDIKQNEPKPNPILANTIIERPITESNDLNNNSNHQPKKQSRFKSNLAKTKGKAISKPASTHNNNNNNNTNFEIISSVITESSDSNNLGNMTTIIQDENTDKSKNGSKFKPHPKNVNDRSKNTAASSKSTSSNGRSYFPKVINKDVAPKKEHPIITSDTTKDTTSTDPQKYGKLSVDYRSMGDDLDMMAKAYSIGVYDDDVTPSGTIIEKLNDFNKVNPPENEDEDEIESEVNSDDEKGPVLTEIVEHEDEDITTNDYDEYNDDYSVHPDVLHREVTYQYQQLRQKLIYKQGGYMKTDAEKEFEPIDENGEEIKFSRFKTARLRAKQNI